MVVVMVRGHHVTVPCIWRTQLPVDYLDTSLVMNNFENVSADLSEGVPARIWYIRVEQTNNGVTAEDVELEITINGTAYTVGLAGIASGTPMYVRLIADLAAGDFSFVDYATLYQLGDGLGAQQTAIPFTADSIGLIRVRQTTGVDPVAAQIEVNIIWDKLERVSLHP